MSVSMSNPISNPAQYSHHGHGVHNANVAAASNKDERYEKIATMQIVPVINASKERKYYKSEKKLSVAIVDASNTKKCSYKGFECFYTVSVFNSIIFHPYGDKLHFDYKNKTVTFQPYSIWRSALRTYNQEGRDDLTTALSCLGHCLTVYKPHEDKEMAKFFQVSKLALHYFLHLYDDGKSELLLQDLRAAIIRIDEAFKEPIKSTCYCDAGAFKIRDIGDRIGVISSFIKTLDAYNLKINSSDDECAAFYERRKKEIANNQYQTTEKQKVMLKALSATIDTLSVD